MITTRSLFNQLERTKARLAAGGKISTSPDGTNWTSRTNTFGSYSILAVTYGVGLFVAVGNNGKTSTSPDGITWTAQTNDFGTSFIYNASYAAALFVAVGHDSKISISGHIIMPDKII